MYKELHMYVGLANQFKAKGRTAVLIWLEFVFNLGWGFSFGPSWNDETLEDSFKSQAQ